MVTRSLERATQRSLERASAFLEAARSLLDEAGAAGFTVQQVADLAGQSLRSFYQHFSSKDDLLLALFEEDLVVHAKDVRTKVDEHHDPVSRLATFVSAGVQVAPHPHAIAMSKYRLGMAASRPIDLTVVEAPVVALARELVCEAIEAGAIPPCDPDAAAYVLVTLKSAYTHSNLLGNELGTRMPSPDELAVFCVRGLGAE